MAHSHKPQAFVPPSVWAHKKSSELAFRGVPSARGEFPVVLWIQIRKTCSLLLREEVSATNCVAAVHTGLFQRAHIPYPPPLPIWYSFRRRKTCFWCSCAFRTRPPLNLQHPQRWRCGGADRNRQFNEAECTLLQENTRVLLLASVGKPGSASCCKQSLEMCGASQN